MALYRITQENSRRIAANACMQAPIDYCVTIKPWKRSLEQSAMLHKLCSDIAKTRLYIGRKIKLYQWKAIFVSAHAIATGLGSDLVPGLEGEFVNIRESTADMSVSRMSSLIEYILAWQAQNESESRGLNSSHEISAAA